MRIPSIDGNIYLLFKVLWLIIANMSQIHHRNEIKQILFSADLGKYLFQGDCVNVGQESLLPKIWCTKKVRLGIFLSVLQPRNDLNKCVGDNFNGWQMFLLNTYETASMWLSFFLFT